MVGKWIGYDAWHELHVYRDGDGGDGVCPDAGEQYCVHQREFCLQYHGSTKYFEPVSGLKIKYWANHASLPVKLRSGKKLDSLRVVIVDGAFTCDPQPRVCGNAWLYVAKSE